MESVLILIVGNNISRALKAIEIISPSIVYFIRTEDYKNYQMDILKEPSVIYEPRTKIVKNFQRIEDTYNVSKEIFEEIDDENYDIKVSISNGFRCL